MSTIDNMDEFLKKHISALLTDGTEEKKMLKRLVNECQFTLTIHTEGPVLVKSGYATVFGPDMTPVRTYRNGMYRNLFTGEFTERCLSKSH